MATVWQQDPSWTQQTGVLTGILGRAPCHLSQPLTNGEASRCSSLARSRARPKKWMAGEGSSSEGRRQEQELLWRQFFLDPTLWWDNRQDKKSSRSPDFRRKGSGEVLWVYNFYNPAWVDEQIAALDMQMGRPAPTSKSSLSDMPDPGRPAGCEMGVTAETVSTMCQLGKLTEAVDALEVLVQTDCPVSKSLIYTVLKQCVAQKDLVLGRRVHALTIKLGYESDTFLCNHILRMYASHGRLQDAMNVFIVVTKPDAFTWSAIISAHVKHGQDKRAIQLYHQMCRSSVKPDSHVFVAALQACARGADLETGQQVHADVLSSGVESDLFVCSGLVDMYAKCGSLEDARSVFEGLPQKNVVTWNAMMAGYARQGMGHKALNLYTAMQGGIAIPNSVTFTCLLQACASVGSPALEKGKQFHAEIRERGLDADVVVGGSLVNMYAKCGSLEAAQSVFDRLPQKDVVTWTSMIAGYTHQGMGQAALNLYFAMQEDNIAAPDSATFVCLLQACASVGSLALQKGKQFHAQIRGQGLETDVVVGGSLVNMYAKCGNLGDAQSLFDRLPQKNVVTWTAMLAGYSQHGMGQEALHLFSAMQDEGITAPNSVTFVCLLQACASVGIPALEKGKQFHAQIREQGLEADVVVGGSLVNMYAKCGSLDDAQSVFEGLHHKTVETWNAMIAGYSQQGMRQEALHLYSAMQEEGIVAPNSVTFVCILQACASVGSPALEKGKQFHAEIRERGLEADVVVGGSLVNMYARCGSLEDAQSVFDRLPQKNVVTWNAMIAGCSQQGMGQEALHLYSAMQEEGIAAPSSVTFVCLLQACASVGTQALEQGRQFHAQIREQGLEADVVVGGSLVNMYAKCGSLEDAQSVFHRLPQKNVVTWNAMMAGYSQQGMGQEALHLYSAMQDEGIAAPDSVTFVCLLQACVSVGIPALEKGKQFHAQIQERGLEADVVIGGSLVNMYAKCGNLEDAQSVFDRLPQKDVVTWTTMIAGYSQQGMGHEALRVHSAMQDEGIIAPNSVTFMCLLQACASVGIRALENGKKFHAQIREQGLEADVVVGGSLVNMYAKCGSLEDAQSVFDGLEQKTVETWNAILAGYTQQGMGEAALHLYSVMQEDSIAAPDSVTFVCLLQACASVGISAFEKGKQFHAQIRECGLEADVVVGASLVNMYAKCGSLEGAQSLFERLPQKDVVTWNAMIAGYSQQGMGQEALHLYSAMQESIAAPDAVTFVCLLQACASVAALPLGKQLHAQIEQRGMQVDLGLGTSLVNMYAKCGSMADAQQMFDALPKRNNVAWSALIAGYTRQGDTEAVFDLVRRMTEDGIQPGSITFVSVLSACSHAGLVNKGREYFNTMSRHYGITPTVEHYTCMVDLLGRAGQLGEALEVVRTMPVKANDVVWHTLLGACRKWSNVEVGRHAFDEAVKLDEKDAAAYVTMFNIYTGAQMWEEAQKMQARRKEIGAWKQPGQSWWADMSGKVHAFLVGDKQHPESDAIYARLKQLVPKMKKVGYVPHLDSSLRGTSDVDKEAHLCGHSERLAIAYALNKTPEGTTIRIVKNLRVCDDCHRATAYISKIEKRTIICRDASRFHVYEDGKCSCGDYW